MEDTPKVFISYSHDNDKHKKWVLNLACKLQENGIETTLDQWELSLGSDLPKFMEKGLTTTGRVLVICTENYIEKANNGVGGVGYEKTILTAELIENQDTKKFIPIIRNVKRQTKTPTCLVNRLYIDFSNGDCFEVSFKKLLHEIHEVPLNPKPKLGKNPFIEKDTTPKLNDDSTVFFYERFTSAFPGVRGVEWFKEPKVAIDRLSLLLKEPIVFSNQRPVWWWRFGNLHINSFEKIDDSTGIMDHKELKIEEIAAVNAGSYYQSFVYVKVTPSTPSGLYDYSYIDEAVKHSGYANEEFAVYKNRFITRAEYDDGATIIDGLPVDLNGEAELRVRYLTPYNFVIAPHNSPINNVKFDSTLERLLNGI